MNKIYSFALRGHEPKIMMPLEATVLSAVVYEGAIHLSVLASADKDEGLEERRFVVYTDGQEVPYEPMKDMRRFIGTVQLQAQHVLYHIFELQPASEASED
jgi:hypothetical protein